MKIQEIMSDQVISIGANESVAVAARTLAHYNIGALPVCGAGGTLCGMVTDRDLVTRCIASGKRPENTRVREVMTTQITAATPGMDTGAAAHLMGRLQIRRLPVVENGRLCGMVSIGDLANREQSNPDAADALGEICRNISQR